MILIYKIFIILIKPLCSPSFTANAQLLPDVQNPLYPKAINQFFYCNAASRAESIRKHNISNPDDEIDYIPPKMIISVGAYCGFTSNPDEATMIELNTKYASFLSILENKFQNTIIEKSGKIMR